MSALSGSTIAYFSMEICLDEAIPTYSGGLGVLAGDTLRSAADLEYPIVGVTLLHRKGYFRQLLDAQGNQLEQPVEWSPETTLAPVDAQVTVQVAGREVVVRAWRFDVTGISGHVVPVYLLDTALPENSEWDRTLTDMLYGGDNYYRLCQEVVLGMGGVALLRKLGHGDATQFHMNEGHSALLTLSLVEQAHGGKLPFEFTEADAEWVRRRCIFTTHTPVPAGHDRFPNDMVKSVLGADRAALLEAAGGLNGEMNMTRLALRFSRYVNGVAMRHGEVSRGMFPEYPIASITNGVHALTWTSPAFRELFDRHIPEWRRDNQYLRHAIGIPAEEIQEAHMRAKLDMIIEVERRAGVLLDPDVFTIGFARRATPYKRADLIFSEIDRLRAIAKRVGPMQIVFGGKAHPADGGGKALVRRIHEAAVQLGESVKVVYLENYEMSLGRVLTSGVDLWLNNPLKPLEASGTSGMKAALNGVPSLSVLDGWWIEGHLEGTTGWAIGDSVEPETDPARDATALYYKLEQVILPLFYRLPAGYAEVQRSAIALNGAFFNTQRMVEQYMRNAYMPASNALPFVEAARRTTTAR
jgi:starch phosphorylase